MTRVDGQEYHGVMDIGSFSLQYDLCIDDEAILNMDLEAEPNSEEWIQAIREIVKIKIIHDGTELDLEDNAYQFFHMVLTEMVSKYDQVSTVNEKEPYIAYASDHFVIDEPDKIFDPFVFVGAKTPLQ